MGSGYKAVFTVRGVALDVPDATARVIGEAVFSRNAGLVDSDGVVSISVTFMRRGKR